MDSTEIVSMLISSPNFTKEEAQCDAKLCPQGQKQHHLQNECQDELAAIMEMGVFGLLLGNGTI